MKFTITSGNPSAEELLVLEIALANHEVKDLNPIIKRSAFGLAQLRQPLPHQNTFLARRKSN